MLTRRWLLVFALLLSLSMGGIAQAQEATAEQTPEAATRPDLTPFTIRQFEVSGVRPADWDVLRPGGYTRSRDDSDITALLHITSNAASVAEAAAPFYPALFIDDLPESSGDYEGAVYTWDLYDISFSPADDAIDQVDVQVAAAQDADAVYLIFFQALPEEFEALRDEFMLPAMDNFGRPLGAIYESLGLAPLERQILEAFNLRTVTPVGWENVNPGAYMRQSSPDDPTTLLIQRATDVTADELGAQLLAQLGIPGGLPDSHEAYSTPMLEWELYRIDVQDDTQPVTLSVALADADMPADADMAPVYLVVLLAPADESDALREDVWLPVLDATEPIAR